MTKEAARKRAPSQSFVGSAERMDTPQARSDADMGSRSLGVEGLREEVDGQCLDRHRTCGNPGNQLFPERSEGRGRGRAAAAPRLPLTPQARTP